MTWFAAHDSRNRSVEGLVTRACAATLAHSLLSFSLRTAYQSLTSESARSSPTGGPRRFPRASCACAQHKRRRNRTIHLQGNVICRCTSDRRIEYMSVGRVFDSSTRDRVLAFVFLLDLYRTRSGKYHYLFHSKTCQKGPRISMHGCDAMLIFGSGCDPVSMVTISRF